MKALVIFWILGLFVLFSGCVPQEAIFTQTNQINVLVTNVATSEIPDFLIMYPTNGQVVGTVHEIKGRVIDDGAPSSVYVQTSAGWFFLDSVTNYWRLLVTNLNLGEVTYRAYTIDSTGQSSITDTVSFFVSNVVPSVILDWDGGFLTNTNVLTLGIQVEVGASAFITNLALVLRVNGMDSTNVLPTGGPTAQLQAFYPVTLTPNALNEVRVLAWSDKDSVPASSAVSLITADLTPPLIGITSPSNASTQGLLFDLNGTFNDSYGLDSLFVAWEDQTNVLSGRETWSCQISPSAESDNFEVRVWGKDRAGNQSSVESLHFQISNIPGLSCNFSDFDRTNSPSLNLEYQASVGGSVLLTNVSIFWGTNLFEHTNTFSTNVSSLSSVFGLTFVENKTNYLKIRVQADNGSESVSSIKKIFIDTQAPFFSVTNLFVTNEGGVASNVQISGVIYDSFHGQEQLKVWASGDYRYREVAISGDYWWFYQKFSSVGTYTNVYRVSDGLNVFSATNWIRVFERPYIKTMSPSVLSHFSGTQDLIIDFNTIITNTNDVSLSLNPSDSFSKEWSLGGKRLTLSPTTEWRVSTNYTLSLSHFYNSDGIEGRATNVIFSTALFIPNASFEYGTLDSGDILDGTLTNWEAVSGSSFVVLSNGLAMEGNRCFWWKSLSTTARDQWSEKIPVHANSNYTLSLSAFQPADNPLPAEVAFQVQYYFSDGTANTNNSSDVSSYTVLSVSDDWQTIQYSFSPPEDTALIRVRFKAKTSSTTNSQVGIDRVYLKEN